MRLEEHPHVAIRCHDVSQKDTTVSVVDEDGRQIWRGKVKTDPFMIADVIALCAPNAKRIGLETGPLSTWLWHALNDLGLPLVCLDARHAKAGLSVQVNKTDENDALGLAQLVRTGWYREVKVKSLESHLIRGVLGARAQLVSTRIQMTTTIRGLLRISESSFRLAVGKPSPAQPRRRSVIELTSQQW